MQKEYVNKSSEALEKTVITENWQVFLKKLCQYFIHHTKILKVTFFSLKPFAVQEFSTKMLIIIMNIIIIKLTTNYTGRLEKIVI